MGEGGGGGGGGGGEGNVCVQIYAVCVHSFRLLTFYPSSPPPLRPCLQVRRAVEERQQAERVLQTRLEKALRSAQGELENARADFAERENGYRSELTRVSHELELARVQLQESRMAQAEEINRMTSELALERERMRSSEAKIEAAEDVAARLGEAEADLASQTERRRTELEYET